jgi:hypothetical protein
MGRSVETVNNAEVIYFDCEDYCGDLDAELWDNMISNVRAILIEHYSSLVEVDKWLQYPYRENKIILENYHIQISASEYCGCGAFSVFVNPATESQYSSGRLAKYWLKQNIGNIEKLVKRCVCSLTKIGTFSNGEAVFTKGNNDNEQ